MSRYGDDGEHRVASAKALATVLHLHRGTPYVYQGDELGMHNAPFAGVEDYRDIESLNAHAAARARGDVDLDGFLVALGSRSRDHARTPVQWNASPGAGFTTGTPWIGINPDSVDVNAAAQVGDPDSVFTHHRRLVDLRHDDPVVTDGDFALLLPEHAAVWAFLRRGEDAELLVAANLSGEPVEVDLPVPGWAAADVVLGNLPGPPAAAPDLRLRPWEAVVWRRSTA